MNIEETKREINQRLFNAIMGCKNVKATKKIVSIILKQSFVDGLLSHKPYYDHGRVSIVINPEIRSIDFTFKFSLSE